MRSKNITHSKVKNTGILFELLVRQITVDAMNGNSDSAAMNLLRKYFSPNRELGKELQLYHAFNTTSVLSEIRAVQFIDLILKRRRKLDEKKLAREKYDLVKEIKQNYNLKEFTSARIPNYKLLASIYKTFLAEIKDDDIMNLTEVASAKFTLIEQLSSSKAQKKREESLIYEELKKHPEDLRLLSYKLMLDKFNSRYTNLSTKQKDLLREYINHISNSEGLLTYIKKEVPQLKKEIISLSKLEKNKVIQIKLNEVASLLDSIVKKSRIYDSDITALMIAYQIVQEVKT